MRANHRHWTVFASICLLLLLVELQFSCGSAPHDLVNRVPIGSKLSELDRYLNRGSGSYGEVIEWARADKLADRSAVQIQNEFGLFIKKDKGFYDQWQASKQERDRFSGEIRFIHHGTTSSDVNSFIYIDGKLQRAEWGFLPG